MTFPCWRRHGCAPWWLPAQIGTRKLAQSSLLLCCHNAGQNPQRGVESSNSAVDRQEAGILLWYHALCGPDSAAALAAAGVHASCLAVLESAASVLPLRATAAGLLLALCRCDCKMVEAITRAKSPGGSSAVAIFHSALSAQPGGGGHLSGIAPLLATLVAEPAVRASAACDWPVTSCTQPSVRPCTVTVSLCHCVIVIANAN